MPGYLLRPRTWRRRARRTLRRALGLPPYVSLQGWWIAYQRDKAAKRDAAIPEPWLKSFWETLTNAEQAMYMSEYFGDSDATRIGSSPQFPAKHVAFSGLPGVGRPLVWKDGAAVLNSDWECPEPEKAIREKWRAYRVKVEELVQAVGGTDVRSLAYPHRDGRPPRVTFEQLHANLKSRVSAAKKLERLLASAPPHPSDIG